MNSGNYKEAKDIFYSLGDFKDSKNIIEHCDENIYNEAIEAKKQDNLEEAIKKFKYLFFYKDCPDQVKIIDEINSIKKANIGEIVKYGIYEQDAKEANGKEPIEWIVLDKKDNKAFLLSKYGLEMKNYNDTDVKTDWENSSIRKWLNEDFCSRAFNQLELHNIDKSNILDNNIDRIFLLSLEEFEDYFKNKEELKPIVTCEPTELVKQKNDYNGEGDGKNDWRLRTLCYSECESVDKRNDLIRVNKDNQIEIYKINQYLPDYSKNRGLIRPAMWLKLDFNE